MTATATATAYTPTPEAVASSLREYAEWSAYLAETMTATPLALKPTTPEQIEAAALHDLQKEEATRVTALYILGLADEVEQAGRADDANNLRAIAAFLGRRDRTARYLAQQAHLAERVAATIR